MRRSMTVPATTAAPGVKMSLLRKQTQEPRVPRTTAQPAQSTYATPAAANAPSPFSDQCSAIRASRLPLRRRSQVKTNPAIAVAATASTTGVRADQSRRRNPGEADVAAGQTQGSGDMPEAEQQRAGRRDPRNPQCPVERAVQHPAKRQLLGDDRL